MMAGFLALSISQLNTATDESIVVSSVQACRIVRARLRSSSTSVWIARPIVSSQLDWHQICWLWWTHIWQSDIGLQSTTDISFQISRELTVSVGSTSLNRVVERSGWRTIFVLSPILSWHWNQLWWTISSVDTVW